MNPKIALCLSGHLRDGDKTSYPKLKELILDRYDCDIFVSSWDVNAFGEHHFNFNSEYSHITPEEGVSERIINIYKPKKYNIETGKPSWLSALEQTWGKTRLGNGDANMAHVSSMLAMFKKIEDADALRQSHQIETGAKYDLVIRFRLDAAPDNDFIAANRNLWENKRTVIFTPFLDFGFRDILFFGDAETMALATGVYSNPCFDVQGIKNFRNAEHVLKNYIIKRNISHAVSFNMNFIANFRPSSMNHRW